ncbi:uncharacterized protein [Cherax quadricarinatus]|uniref:uncharacterized protein isoform X3 n=1 Tax=Cherax quadricarinatus TaxID=27406 RepID=UPI00387E677B
MSNMKVEVNMKVKCVLHKLSGEQVSQEDAVLQGDADDTVLHKLHTHLHLLLTKDVNGYEWAQEVGLVSFIEALLATCAKGNTKNPATVAFALKALASLIATEENFDIFIEEKVLCHFLLILPNIRSDPSLSSSALILVQAIYKHKAGLYWLIKNGIWEQMLLPCLRSPSMFVQREGVHVITSFMLLTLETKHFESLLKDLLIISDKFCELRRQVSKAEGEELKQSNLCVLQIFKQLFLQTLGKVSVYSAIGNVAKINQRLLSLLNYKISVTSVTCCTDVLILNILHKFQEQLMGYGILEQFLLDSLCWDMISLTRLLLEKGYIESFLRSSVNTHKYWMIMVQNLKDTKDIDLTSVEALLHIVTNFQVTSILVLYRSSLDDLYKECPKKREVMLKWNDEIHSRINVKEDIKVEASKLEKQIVESLDKDPHEAIRLAVVCISTFTGATEYLNQTCAVTVFQGLVFLLSSQDFDYSPMRYHSALQRAVIDGLRELVEKFNMDWRKCYASVCLMAKLCDVVNIPGISPQVKVCTLKAMNSCISGFIPPVMSMLVNSEQMENNSVELMGRVLSIYLGDRDWEVRDSALEILVTCMKLAKEKYPHFVDWLLRYKLNLAVMTALGDVEGYVRASAFYVLANIISIEKVYTELKEENLAHKALTFSLREGESTVRKAALTLVQELFLAGKYSQEEINGLVVRVVQHSAEDPDDEVRITSLEFIHTHILWTLNKSGMVDGEFPQVTFSKGKIIKLDKEKVRSLVYTVLTWICECGYLCSLLTCVKDLVISVAAKAREIFCFINELVTRYEIHLEGNVKTRKLLENSIADTKVKDRVKVDAPSVVNVAGHPAVIIPQSKTLRDEIDKTISDILSSSSLESVTKIKRSVSESMDKCPLYSRAFLLTLEDVPAVKPAFPLSCLLQSIESLCQCNSINEDNKYQINEMVSLLDDILLDGSEQQSHIDDQRVRDCY